MAQDVFLVIVNMNALPNASFEEAEKQCSPQLCITIMIHSLCLTDPVFSEMHDSSAVLPVEQMPWNVGLHIVPGLS